MSNLLPELDAYLKRVVPASGAVLQKMERRARRLGFPIIGPLGGRLLYQQAKMVGARRVFELGSGYGYSALWFALAAGRAGEIHLTDYDERNLELAKKYFSEAKLKSSFVYHQGDALECFRATRGKFDVIYNDIDKESYPDVVRYAVPRLRRGGLLISDNLIWNGKVFGRARDAETRAIREHTKLIYEHPRLVTTIIPIRDGIAVSLKV